MQKISIIIPVYNVEKYIRKCVDSILSQTYKNLEIILVDDGSLDNCGKICDQYAKIDNRVVVIHKQNGGLSSARNIGIEKATGEYLMFVDSDDSLEKIACESLINITNKTNADIVLPDGMKTENTESFKDIIDKVIKSEDLSKLVNYKNLIL